MEEAKARVARLESAIEEAVPDWSLAPMVTALMAMRGIDLVAAATILAEVGDLWRFQSPRELMAWLGLVPSEASTGDRSQAVRHHQGRQRAGAARSDRKRMVLSLSCAHWLGEASAGRGGLAGRAADRLEGPDAAHRPLPGADAQRQMKTVVMTAVARELAGFVWAMHRALERGAGRRMKPLARYSAIWERASQAASCDHNRGRAATRPS